MSEVAQWRNHTHRREEEEGQERPGNHFEQCVVLIFIIYRFLLHEAWVINYSLLCELFQGSREQMSISPQMGQQWKTRAMMPLKSSLSYLQSTGEGDWQERRWPQGSHLMAKDHPRVIDNLTQRAMWSHLFSQYPMSWVLWHLLRPLAARRGQKEVMAGLPAECLPFLFQPGSVNSFASITIDLATLNLSAYFVAIATGPRQSLPQDGNG